MTIRVREIGCDSSGVEVVDNFNYLSSASSGVVPQNIRSGSTRVEYLFNGFRLNDYFFYLDNY